MLTAPNTPMPSVAADDPRVGNLLGTAVEPGQPPAIVLIGFPVDEGVRRNGGRIGAAEGPAAIRQAFYRLTPDPAVPAMSELLRRTVDLGDVAAGENLEAAQEALAEATAPHLAAGSLVIVLGGGHETAFGHFLGAVRAGIEVELLNWDAHADVRPLRDGLGHSGSPFRQALEHPSGLARRYTVAGLQPQSIAAAHLDYVRAHGRAVFASALTSTVVTEIYALLQHRALASFDLDALDQSLAPGVSAPASNGLGTSLWLDAAERAGANPNVIGCEIVELNPRFDRDDQTARLAALTVWRVIRGRTMVVASR
ncbi:MAG TPA: formimidoylglutamase [Gemmatimonadales bacterium]|nr:formimidoylglutamase [Gemmatimonadales bacterium]